jgi:hypothetical protein
MTHTPGPWAIRTLENFGFNIVHYIDGNKFDIARVAKCGDEGDAKLIAAAPELLEVVKDFTENPLCQVAVGGNPTMVDEFMTRARAVIAKATQ